MHKKTLIRPHRRLRLEAPALESLEGRQLMAARFATMRVTEIASEGTVQLQIMGTRRADTVSIEDNGTDAAGNVILKFIDGSSYSSKKAVDEVVFVGARGNDKVTYKLTGDLITTRAVNVNLGQGDDQFDANLAGSVVATNATLNLQAFGNAGNDRLTTTQTGKTHAGIVFPYLSGDQGNDTITYTGSGDVSFGATLGPALIGGSGNDVISSDYAGVVSGSYMYNLTGVGGKGNDKIRNTITAKPGSTGKLGASSTTPASVVGGEGDDEIEFSVSVDPEDTTFATNTVIIGGGGTDKIRRTTNVTGDASNETDILL